jgi:hypothetical protein
MVVSGEQRTQFAHNFANLHLYEEFMRFEDPKRNFTFSKKKVLSLQE